MAATLVLALMVSPAIAQTPAPAATLPKAGTYAVSIFISQGEMGYCLVKVTPKSDGVAGELLWKHPGIGGGMNFESLTLEENELRINCRSGAGHAMTFAFELHNPAAEVLLGSFAQLNTVQPARMAITDKTEIAPAATFVRGAGPTAIFQSQNQLRLASRNKASADQVRGWAENLLKAAQPYGERYVREVTKQIPEALVFQDAYAPLSWEYADRAAQQLTANDPADQQERILTTLALAQRKAGKDGDADATTARLAKLHDELDGDFLAKVPPFKPTAYEGRKGTSDRAVVVELFTGTQCLPCIAADVAFDVLAKTYKPTEVVLLQHHLHIPSFDPLTNPNSEARARYYGVNSTPNIFFNGKHEAGGGGSLAAAENRYKQFRGVVDRLLEEPAKAAVRLGADRHGDVVTLRADVSNVTDPGDGKKLRFVLVEESVRYVGSNKMRFHHMVVRAMPGGPDGVRPRAPVMAATAIFELS
jgi:hypothetical protein